MGELEVTGFQVSHTKDGISWGEWEEVLLEWLKGELDSEPLPLLRQSEGYRAQVYEAGPQGTRSATKDASEAMVQSLPPVIDRQLEESALPPLPSALEPADTSERNEVLFELEHAHRQWRVAVELVSDARRDSWVEIAANEESGTATQLDIRMNLAHPFMLRFAMPGGEERIPFTRLAAALGIAEMTARGSTNAAGAVRRNLNELLRMTFSGPVGGGTEDD